ncbi:Protein TRANSPARENT TESTA 9 [Turnera subulata]|uniref:Protein TRANSPARENT TESTA 9 n=1 Tax=Turnera subulata TaxID=218843 RepID=A0A9Q0G9Q2_9ROSI|nr:Protein TRANSPARENT TESTA 9 [Turnera subulata]
MWLSFWRSRDQFSLDQLRYYCDQLQKIQVVNEVNKDFVIEAVRRIAELIIYGDQHDPNYFELFMEKQVMGEFVRILKISRTTAVAIQLLQTMGIVIQNLKSEHAIYYIFSNEHTNFLITYKFDFRNEELLSYYISFLRAISGKLDKDTVSLLVKTENEDVVSFPLYTEAIRFAFHEENMVRTAVRALTLNVYHVGDESVNIFFTRGPHADYFTDLVKFFRKQCFDLDGLVSETVKNPDKDATAVILAAVDEIEDNLYYISDVISAGIPDVGRLITDNILQYLILPLILPSVQLDNANEMQIGAITSLYLLCCILRIVKIKDLANTIAAALFCPPEAFLPMSETKFNGYLPNPAIIHDNKLSETDNGTQVDGCLRETVPDSSTSSQVLTNELITENDVDGSHRALRDTLLSYVVNGDDLRVLGSLSVLATLLQTKELDELMLDALGILPQRKQHKKLLLQALVGEGSGEEQLFSTESSFARDSFNTQIGGYLQKLKVLDALVSLLCRPSISSETLWDGGWLLRQLLPYSEAEFNSQHLKLLKEAYKDCAGALADEARGIWPDLLITVLCNEWKKCKRAIEASSPRKEPKCILLPLKKRTSDDVFPSESSFVAGERMWELVKVFVLLHQLQIFSLGRTLPEQPSVCPTTNLPEKSRARTAGLDISGPKPGSEIKLVDAVPCRIAFERGKERHFFFLAVSVGISGWILLAEDLPLKQHYGIVRITAPLAGSSPRIDDKHPMWLHLRVRPSSLPFVDSGKSVSSGKVKSKALVDGRWTLAFRDEESSKSALSMILEELGLQSDEVERKLKPLLNLEEAPSEAPSKWVTPCNSFPELESISVSNT